MPKSFTHFLMIFPVVTFRDFFKLFDRICNQKESFLSNLNILPQSIMRTYIHTHKQNITFYDLMHF